MRSYAMLSFIHINKKRIYSPSNFYLQITHSNFCLQIHPLASCMSLCFGFYFYPYSSLLHLILYEVPHCDFHHIDGDFFVGDFLLVPWSFCMDLGRYTIIQFLLFLVDGHGLMVDVYDFHATCMSCWTDHSLDTWVLVISLLSSWSILVTWCVDVIMLICY